MSCKCLSFFKLPKENHMPTKVTLLLTLTDNKSLKENKIYSVE